tara:strand:+ start:533 stop:670 length:138 start_codon:yes stop_codon:yes gene_type:complete
MRKFELNKENLYDSFKKTEINNVINIPKVKKISGKNKKYNKLYIR